MPWGSREYMGRGRQARRGVTARSSLLAFKGNWSFSEKGKNCILTRDKLNKRVFRLSGVTGYVIKMRLLCSHRTRPGVQRGDVTKPEVRHGWRKCVGPALTHEMMNCRAYWLLE